MPRPARCRTQNIMELQQKYENITDDVMFEQIAQEGYIQFYQDCGMECPEDEEDTDDNQDEINMDELYEE